MDLPTADSLNFEDIPHDDINLDFDDRQDSQGLLAPEAGSSSSSDIAPNASVWSIDYYRVYFNVGTKDIRDRLLRSMMPRSAFFARGEVPDLYGPFWIVTSLVVILAVTGNFASYIHFLPTDKDVEWKMDFEKVTIAASVFYTMISIIPLCLYFAIRRIGVSDPEPWITHLISLYGYSFTTYIPAAFVCVPPFDLLRWVTILLVFSLSSYFLVKNVRGYMPTESMDAKAKFQASMLLVAIVCCHAGVALVTKLYFFSYATLPDLPAAPTAAAVAPTAGAPVVPAPAPAPAAAVKVNGTKH